MRIDQLFEAPIGDIYTHGDFAQPGSFRQDDLSLSTTKRQDKIKRVLQKAPVLIDLHFVNLPKKLLIIQHVERTWPRHIGYLEPDFVRKRWGAAITPRADALNLVYLQNEGDARLPLTPWIIAHRLCHAMDHADHFALRDMLNAFDRTLNRVSDIYSPREFIRQYLPSAFGTTRACREKTIIRSAEWFHDCFAQMCVVGDIRFNPAPAEVAGASADPQVIDQEFAKLRATLLDGFHKMLENGIGKLLVF